MNSLGRAGRSSGETLPHIVAVCGSRREGSYTRRALQQAQSGVEAADETVELLDLADIDLPLLDPDVEETEDSDVVRRTIREADAVILGTPMYHGSYSSVLKNALDYCGFDEFKATTVGLLIVSGGPFPTPALTHLRDVYRALNAWALPYQAAIPQTRTAFDGDGLTYEDLRERVRTLGVRAVEYAAIEPGEVLEAQLQEV